ncbi:MAG: PTS sugar transporter subunit IIA [SAR324 cluster bacterium]|nr:PTS sugar transporter subunit IIA [SAR324 cluster bacterium]MBL7035324.1 PTS sugar transporter subunit IIA [SAR324 cluster bacterium]
MSKWLIVSDVVQLLHVPEATIYRWIRQGDIPCVVRRGKYYFNQSTLVSWAKTKHIHLEEHSRRLRKNKAQVLDSQFPLIEAIQAGKAYHSVPSASIEILFQAIASQLDLPHTITDSLSDKLLQREKLTSTGIGNGIAIPHSKTPVGNQITQSLVGTFFLEKPLDFKAPDGLPVFVVFALISLDSFHHLQLLSQLARILSQSDINDFLRNEPTLENLVEHFKKTLAQTA